MLETPELLSCYLRGCKYDFIAFIMDIFSMKINIVVTDGFNDLTYSRENVNTRGHNTFIA